MQEIVYIFLINEWIDDTVHGIYQKIHYSQPSERMMK